MVLEKQEKDNHSKHFWKSKTFWVCAIAFIASRLQSYFGVIINPMIQMDILVGVFLLLRIITKEPVDWGLHFPKITDDFSKIFIIMCFCLGMFSCASPMKKACKELTKIKGQLGEAITIAQIAHEQAPKTVKEEHIQELIMMRDMVTNLASSACILGELLPDK